MTKFYLNLFLDEVTSYFIYHIVKTRNKELVSELDGWIYKPLFLSYIKQYTDGKNC